MIGWIPSKPSLLIITFTLLTCLDIFRNSFVFQFVERPTRRYRSTIKAYWKVNIRSIKFFGDLIRPKCSRACLVPLVKLAQYLGSLAALMSAVCAYTPIVSTSNKERGWRTSRRVRVAVVRNLPLKVVYVGSI